MLGDRGVRGDKKHVIVREILKGFIQMVRRKSYHVLPIHAGIGHIVADLFSRV